MWIKIIFNNILEITYIIYQQREPRNQLVRVRRGHPIFKFTITKEIYLLKSTKKYIKY